MSDTPQRYTNHPFVELDPQHPKSPESFFAYLGDTGIAQPVYTGREVATLEELYQAFKARLLNELLQEGWLFQPTEFSRRLADMDGAAEAEDGDEAEAEDQHASGEEADSPEAWAARKAGGGERKRGRPRLTDEERAARAARRRAVLPDVSADDEPLSHPDLIDRGLSLQNDVAVTAEDADNDGETTENFPF